MLHTLATSVQCVRLDVFVRHLLISSASVKNSSGCITAIKTALSNVHGVTPGMQSTACEFAITCTEASKQYFLNNQLQLYAPYTLRVRKKDSYCVQYDRQKTHLYEHHSAPWRTCDVDAVMQFTSLLTGYR